MLFVALGACTSASPVAELAPGIHGLTTHASTAATAARLGVERARQFCAAQGRGFEATRSEIGARDYKIAFRCPRAEGLPAATLAQPNLAQPVLAPSPLPPPPAATGDLY
ncbi:hypothetical protein [Falsiroseomonas sp.]|uniref:hypothetical protein n=1 Tax=Falsiroseomonas sp. TaxID=2870721 RepID=UPI003F71F3A9